jgi:hypothetical protein
MRRVLLLALLAQLAGCYTLNEDRFAAYVAETVWPGMPWAQANERMHSAGFTCNLRAISLETACSRVQHSLLYTCVEHVHLTMDNEHKTVTSVSVAPRISCAGL